MLAKSKIAGAIINHSEHRVPISHIREAVNRLSKLNLLSIVCAKNVSESGKMAALNPNFVAVEPPDLIGTGRSVSEHKPKKVVQQRLSQRQKTGQNCCVGQEL